MLQITIPESEIYDEELNEFISSKKTVLQMEHSLLSLSKWESKWHKPFLSDKEKTNEEILDYIKCMTLTQNTDPSCFEIIGRSAPLMRQINDYIDNPMTATWFNEKGKEGQRRKSKSTVTSEIIYYWMIALNIPFECQKWHLNRLLTLIRVCNEKNEPPKKMSKKDAMSKQKALNAARRMQYGTSG